MWDILLPEHIVQIKSLKIKMQIFHCIHLSTLSKIFLSRIQTASSNNPNFLDKTVQVAHKKMNPKFKLIFVKARDSPMMTLMGDDVYRS